MALGKKSYIYKITSPEGKIYIGKTTNIRVRMHSHKNNTHNKCNLIRTSIEEHGWSEHVVVILEEVNDGDDYAFEREKYWIDFYKSNNSRYPNGLGLNLTDGGKGTTGRKLSEETLTKMRESQRGYKSSCAKLVVDITTGVFFDTCKEASECYNMASYDLSRKLVGSRRNKTNLRYV